MSSAPSAEEIAHDAHWLAQALDPANGLVRLVAMDRASYRAASFLDDRLMQQPVDAQIIAWPDLETAIEGKLRTDARWIFHIGHVGSTLVSRLLGEIPGVLALREPRLLRDLAMTPSDVRGRYLVPIAKLMSRTFAPREVACVKATSFASEIAAQLVPAGERALFIYARPRNYLATILAGENSIRELRSLEALRSERLASRDIALAPPRNDADRAAAAWACEMAALQSSADAMSDRHLGWLDFDDLLVDLPGRLARIAEFFGFTVEEDQLRAILGGPLTQRYSKDLNYDYSPALRQQLIDQELRLQGGDIEAALAMLRAASEKSTILARALCRVEGN